MVLLQQATALYFFAKKKRNFYPFLILFLILSCLYFCFSLMQVGGGMKGTNQEVKWGKFCSGKQRKRQCIFLEEGEKISHLSDVMTTIPEYISPVRLIDKKVVTGKQTVETVMTLIMRLIKPWEPLSLREQDKVLILGVVLFNSLRESTYLLKGQIMIHESLARKKNKLSVGRQADLVQFSGD